MNMGVYPSGQSFTSFPNELLLHILHLSPPSVFFSLICTCKRLYSLSKDKSFSAFHRLRRWQKRYLNSDGNPGLAQRIHVACAILNAIDAHAPEFVHEHHTCYNKSINTSCTKDLPKSINFSTTYNECSWLVVHCTNVGPGEAAQSIMHALGLELSHMQEHHWQTEDAHAVRDRKRKATKEFKHGKKEHHKKQK
jgi:hypothetical protein